MSDYPVNPVAVNHVESVPRRIRAFLGGRPVFDTTNARYVWENTSYPQYYIPLSDIDPDALVDEGTSMETSRGDARRYGMRIGEVDRGWDVMQLELTLERAGDHGGEPIRLLAAMEEWAESTVDHTGRARADDPDVRTRLGRAAAENEVISLLCRRSAWIHASGGVPAVEGSMSKLFASEALTRQSADFVDLLGPDGIRSQGDPTAPAAGAADYDIRFALGTTTYGGTSEIQRNIIAQRGLGLPRVR